MQNWETGISECCTKGTAAYAASKDILVSSSKIIFRRCPFLCSNSEIFVSMIFMPCVFSLSTCSEVKSAVSEVKIVMLSVRFLTNEARWNALAPFAIIAVFWLRYS